jgi:Rubisco LSMT substrate-binding
MTLQVAVTFGQYDAKAPRVGYNLTLALPPEEQDRNYIDKLDILEQEDKGAEENFVLEVNTPPPPDLLAFLRLVNLEGLSQPAVIHLASADFEQRYPQHLACQVLQAEPVCLGMSPSGSVPAPHARQAAAWRRRASSPSTLGCRAKHRCAAGLSRVHFSALEPQHISAQGRTPSSWSPSSAARLGATCASP